MPTASGPAPDSAPDVPADTSGIPAAASPAEPGAVPARRTVRVVATTRVERRIARVLALEPGGPPTLRARVANQFIRAIGRNLWAYSPSTDAGLLLVHRLSSLLVHTGALPRGVTVEPQELGACTAEWVRAGAPDEDKVFLYLHGGGYFFGSPGLYRPFNWRLSASTGRAVLALDYRLAPKHTPADALEDAVTAYEFLLGRGYKPEDIVVGGDSAGGHLTLALLLALKERELPLPKAAVCLSPWVDLLCDADSHRTNARTDYLIPAKKLAWLGRDFCNGKPEDDPLYAPARADLTGLPPMLFVASGSEILRDDTREAHERAKAAGVDSVYQEWNGLVHVFPVFCEYVPEGKAAFRHIAEFLANA
ncbi:alpha/beta hydrolase [Actinomadura rupiterrae]|uniref:alpha/beta hydrolase n=1 Tax=Actinomadura rupiterrae TaxID=559627 RepID=UPI0020A30393|nr:alpha/beta hydrolase [Actinomadura rupiterrae]MCP2336681.1 acetyl esterase/lipase [Actinomadura rupiterrae]